MGRRAGNNSAKEESMEGRIARGLALAVAAAALAVAARAQDKWPSRPVRLISTSVAGGNIDVMCRAALARDRCGAPDARSLGAPDRDGAAPDRQHARGIRRELPQGFSQMGGAHQVFRRESGVKAER